MRRVVVGFVLAWAIYLLFLTFGVDWSRAAATNTYPPDCVEYPLTDAVKVKLALLFPDSETQIEVLDGALFVPKGKTAGANTYMALLICSIKNPTTPEHSVMAWQVVVVNGKRVYSNFNYLAPPLAQWQANQWEYNYLEIGGYCGR